MTNDILTHELVVDPEFRDLLPPLDDDAFHRLEASLVNNGWQDWRGSIVTWNGIIVDGHNRYKICREYGIGFRYVERKFPSRDAVKIWIFENQSGRRNLSVYDRSVLALQLEPLYAAEAKRRLSPGTNQYTERSSQKSDETSHIRTDERLAKAAGVSRDTIRKVKVIETEAAKGNQTAIDARDAIRSGQKSLHAAYTEVRSNGDKTDTRRLCTVCGKPIDDGDAYDHDRSKHKMCAYELEKRRKRSVTKAQFAEDGRRICSVCGKPIDDGDFYEYKPSMHKACLNKRNSEQRYANPDRSLLDNVPTYTISSLLAELTSSADNLRDAWAESVSINESMGVSLTKPQKKRLDRAVTNLFKTIQKVREESDNG